MDEFTALIHSFGEHMVNAIGSQGLEQLVVRGHEGSGFAEVEIVLHDQTWDAQIAAIEKVAEIRSMFVDELSFGYQFLDSSDDIEDDGSLDHESEQPAFSLV